MLNEDQNHYELLELSPNANHETIERMFRYLATKWHPDAGGDREKFSQLVAAFETLKDPTSRAAYDVSLEQQQLKEARIVSHAQQAGPDTVDRHKLLRLFYAARRQNGKRPALGSVAVETLMNVPGEILEFHLWYFREKGWIKRHEGGGFCITAEGVDRVESHEIEFANNHLRLTHGQNGSTAITTRQSVPATVPATV